MIAADNYPALLAILLGIVWLGVWSESNKWGRKLPAVLWILMLGMLLSNTKLIPEKSAVYDFIGGTVMPLAIPLLLFKATFTRILKESGKVLPMFFVGAVAVCIGAAVGFYTLNLGPHGAQVATTYAAAWIGGATDMFAMADMVELPKDELAVAIGASAPVSIMGLFILVALPSIGWVRRQIPSKIIDESDAQTPEAKAEDVRNAFSILDVAAALGLSAVICWAGHWVATTSGYEHYSLFIITIITVAIANIVPGKMQAMKGDFDLGMYIMYLFFAIIAASTNVTSFLSSAPVYFVLGCIIIVVHVVLVLLVARLFRFDLADAIIGSGANIVGAAAAAGVASSKGWKSLVTPAIATGMLGKAIATFFGMALYEILQ